MFVDWRFLCGRSVVFVFHSGCGLLTLAGQGLVVSGWWWGFGARRASARARYARPRHRELLEHLTATDMVVLQRFFLAGHRSCAVVSRECYGSKMEPSIHNCVAIAMFLQTRR